MPEIELLSGHVDNVSSIYNACDCHITTTGAEGFGMPIIEGNTIGRVVIAGNNTSMIEVSGQAACLVDSNNIDEKYYLQMYCHNHKVR